MSNDLFVDGICEIGDKKVKIYFSQFGSRIVKFEIQRHRPTNSCCFALLSFVSSHTVNAILRKRPHVIDACELFVKRLLPPNLCSFTERLLPVSSLFVYNKISKGFDDARNLKIFFERFGEILTYEYDNIHNRLFIEYDDYDSVDKIFLNKHELPSYVEINKNILPYAQSKIRYHGTCHRKKEMLNDEKNGKRLIKMNDRSDDQYESLLQKTIENLRECKVSLMTKENDYFLLEMEYAAIKEKYEKLNKRIDNTNDGTGFCISCKEHLATITGLKEKLITISEQYDIIKSRYQQLMTKQNICAKLGNSINEISETNSLEYRPNLLSKRQNSYMNLKSEVSDHCLPQLNSTMSDIEMKEETLLHSRAHSHTQHHRITYKYQSVISDQD